MIKSVSESEVAIVATWLRGYRGYVATCGYRGYRGYRGDIDNERGKLLDASICGDCNIIDDNCNIINDNRDIIDDNCNIIDDNRSQWEELAERVATCSKCRLCENRRNVVIGRGSRTPEALFIGEGPGENEDLQGLPFVGKAGKLLDYALEGLRFDKDSYYISNIVKCRPPGNRTPTDEEAEQCLPFLRQQFKLLKPRVIVCLGSIAVRHIIGRGERITRIRGCWTVRKGWMIMPTFHPAALLRDESKKEEMWQDLYKVRQKLNDLKTI